MPIDVAMPLCEISRHVELCIFCLTEIRDIQRRAEVKYKINEASTKRGWTLHAQAMPHGDELSMPKAYPSALLHQHQNNQWPRNAVCVFVD